MPGYDWREYRTVPWRERFPPDATGSDLWRIGDFADLPGRLESRRRSLVDRPARPCVFVSHRQADVRQAARIAYLACEAGFDFWLDVLDPELQGSGAMAAGPGALAVAAVIEMALLNSTHVVAVITQNTKGSMWVPYEYGRVKDPAPVTLQAASWIAPAIKASEVPEYLYLGVVTRTEQDLDMWLQYERAAFGSWATAPCGWKGGVPLPL